MTQEETLSRVAATDEAGTMKPPETGTSEPSTSLRDTADALQEAVSRQRMKAITDMWDSLAIPQRKQGEQDWDYIQRLIEAGGELAQKVNQFEGAAQSLAEANVRQTNIIAKLRADLVRVKTKWLEAERKLNNLENDE